MIIQEQLEKVIKDFVYIWNGSEQILTTDNEGFKKLASTILSAMRIDRVKLEDVLLGSIDCDEKEAMRWAKIIASYAQEIIKFEEV